MLNNRLSYYHELDGVRAIAAVMVMVFHFFQIFRFDSSLFPVLQKISVLGVTGVSLFFVLSGFLITRILLNTQKGDGYFSRFYIRRSLRIFPLYYFFLILYFFIIPAVSSSEFVKFENQIYFWIYLQNFAMTFNWPWAGPDHFWTLAIEEHFYFFWPLLVFFCSPRRMILVIIGIVVVSFAVRYFLITKDLVYFFRFTFSRFDELALGGLLAILELNGKFTKNASRLSLILSISMLCLLLFSLTFLDGNLLWESSKSLVVALIFFGFIMFLIPLSESNPIKRVLKSKFLSFSGRISYGLYVYHPICFSVFAFYFHWDSLMLTFLGAFGLAFFISFLSYHLIEQRFLKLKDAN